MWISIDSLIRNVDLTVSKCLGSVQNQSTSKWRTDELHKTVCYLQFKVQLYLKVNDLFASFSRYLIVYLSIQFYARPKFLLQLSQIGDWVQIAWVWLRSTSISSVWFYQCLSVALLFTAESSLYSFIWITEYITMDSLVW